jgi:hypothetical protein
MNDVLKRFQQAALQDEEVKIRIPRSLARTAIEQPRDMVGVKAELRNQIIGSLAEERSALKQLQEEEDALRQELEEEESKHERIQEQAQEDLERAVRVRFHDAAARERCQFCRWVTDVLGGSTPSLPEQSLTPPPLWDEVEDIEYWRCHKRNFVGRRQTIENLQVRLDVVRWLKVEARHGAIDETYGETEMDWRRRIGEATDEQLDYAAQVLEAYEKNKPQHKLRSVNAVLKTMGDVSPKAWRKRIGPLKLERGDDTTDQEHLQRQVRLLRYAVEHEDV